MFSLLFFYKFFVIRNENIEKWLTQEIEETENQLANAKLEEMQQV